jgi:ketosteroid isomerase-like protein
MDANQQLIHTFYSAFAQKDYATMQSCYADGATFSDAVFKNLDSAHVKAMWEMLCKRGADMKLEFANITSTPQGGTANWTAGYTFSSTGRKVTNRIQAEFWIEKGKIIKHIDTFSFHTWAKQALGFVGLLLGGTSYLRNKVSKTAMANLSSFMAKNKK